MPAERYKQYSERHGRATGFEVVLDGTILIFAVVRVLSAFFTALQTLNINAKGAEDIKTMFALSRL